MIFKGGTIFDTNWHRFVIDKAQRLTFVVVENCYVFEKNFEYTFDSVVAGRAADIELYVFAVIRNNMYIARTDLVFFSFYF